MSARRIFDDLKLDRCFFPFNQSIPLLKSSSQDFNFHHLILCIEKKSDLNHDNCTRKLMKTGKHVNLHC